MKTRPALRSGGGTVYNGGVMRRFVLIGLSCLAAAVVIGALVIWVLLSTWVPITGTTFFVQELERRYPVDVSIGSVRYGLIQGLVLTNVRVVDVITEEPWCVIPTMRAQVDWLALPLSRSLKFSGHAEANVPIRTPFTFSGEYHLDNQLLVLSAQTAEISLSDLRGALKRAVPSPLVDGTARLQLYLHQPHRVRPTVTGRITGTGVVWATPSWQARGNLMINGTAQPPALEGEPWSVDALVTVSDATLEGVPEVGTISQLEGTAHLRQDRIEIEQLRGRMLESWWTLEGRIALQPPTAEVLVTSRVELAPLAVALPERVQDWQPVGTANLRAVCRGPLSPQPFLDCRSQMNVLKVTLAEPRLPDPLTDITGGMAYDLLTGQLSIDRLTGRIRDRSFTVSGELSLREPREMALEVAGTVPLDIVIPWLPEESLITELNGDAVIDLAIHGSLSAPRPSGTVELHDVAGQLARPAIRVEQLTGTVHLSDEQITISTATLRLNDELLTVHATITAPFDAPRIMTTIQAEEGQLELTTHLTPDMIVIDEGRISLATSQVVVRGEMARRPNRPSLYTLSGTIELAELEQLPFVSLPALHAWNPTGIAEVEMQFRGLLSDWPSATMRGRIQAEQLRLHDVPVHQLVGTIEQKNRVLRITIPSGLVADGSLAGDLTIRHGETTREYVLQVDITGVELAALAHGIPTWEEQEVAGHASAHIVLSGTWHTRPSWRGEGWFNGEGERLGELPMLDTLFRGVFGALATRLNVEFLRRARITEASFRWRLADERISTEDLRLGGLAGTEPIAVYVKGSIGLDQTLDLIIEPELSEQIVLEAPSTSTIASSVLQAAGQMERLRQLLGRHHLTGTISEPEYRFELSMQEVLGQRLPSPVNLLHNLFESLQ